MPEETDATKREREEAWIGDAVLSLYARRWLLDRDQRMDGEALSRMTSNQFLAGTGNPTSVEARIGRLYASEGLEAAFAWIQSELVPRFEKQELNRLRGRQGERKRKRR